MRNKRGSILEVSITDGRGFLTLTFFNQKWRAAELRPGVRGIFAGKVGEYRGRAAAGASRLRAVHRRDAGRGRRRARGRRTPAPAVISVATDMAREWAEQPIPIYPATSTLASWQLGRAIEQVLGILPASLDDPVPDAVRSARGLLPFREALQLVHRPGDRHRLAAGAGCAPVSGGVRAAGGAAASARRAACRRRRRRGCRGRFSAELEESLPFDADARPADRGRRDRARPGRRHPDEPAGAGRGGIGQDPRRAAGDARGRRLGRAVGVPRADRGARGAAPAVARGDARAGPGGAAASDPADRAAAGGRSAAGAAGHGIRGCVDHRGHARAAERSGDVRRPGAGRRRRAAPVRRGPARGAAAEGCRRRTCWC